MKLKPFTIEISSRSVTLTEFTTVPGAAYLQPVQAMRVPLANWRELMANGGPQLGTTTYCNWPPAQLAAHAVESPKENAG